MASTNGSGRPTGCISIPVEIIRDPDSSTAKTHSRHNSPFRMIPNDHAYGSFPDSPSWNMPSNIYPNNSRFQPRQSPSTAYDRVITNSQFNQPLNDRYSYQQVQDPQMRPNHQRMPETMPGYSSRSNEDLLSYPYESMRFSTPTQFTSMNPSSNSSFRPQSDFLHANKFTSPFRRSFETLNDFPDVHTNIPIMRPYPPEQQQQQQQQPHFRSTYQTQHQPQQQYQFQQQQPTYTNQTFINPNIVYTNEFGVPADQRQPNVFNDSGYLLNERARSPNPQRGPSPVRPAPTSQPSQPQQTAQPQQQQQQQFPDEPELKMAKDADGPIPMPAPASFTSQSTDQQVPSTDTTTPSTNNSTNVPTPETSHDPNTIALEKLEQIKQTLKDLEAQVNLFTGTSRNDRSYKALDEQALKIMIRCDELVDVSADIKEKRKEMIHNVQQVINKLESKVPASASVDQNSNPMETSTTIEDSLVTTEDHDQLGKATSHSTSPPKETSDKIISSTEDSIST